MKTHAAVRIVERFAVNETTADKTIARMARTIEVGESVMVCEDYNHNEIHIVDVWGVPVPVIADVSSRHVKIITVLPQHDLMKRVEDEGTFSKVVGFTVACMWKCWNEQQEFKNQKEEGTTE